MKNPYHSPSMKHLATFLVLMVWTVTHRCRPATKVTGSSEQNENKKLWQSPQKVGRLDIHGRRPRVNTNFFNHLLAYRNESCQHIIRKIKEGVHTEYGNNEQPTTKNSSTSDIPVNHGPILPCLVIKMPVPTYKRSNQGSKGNAIRELFSPLRSFRHRAIFRFL